MQDVFLTAWRRLDDAARSGGVRRLARDDRAQPRDRLSPPRPWSPWSCPTTWRRRGTAPAQAEAHAALAAIRSLPDAYRETLVLRLVEGMTGPEIAERTGLTPGIRAREPASRHEAAARQAGPMTDDEDRTGDDDYLWDGSGEPDPEIVRLETLLAPLPSRGTLPLLLPRATIRGGVARRAAALQILTAAASLVAGRRRRVVRVRDPAGGWTVQSLAGAPSVSGNARIDAPSRLPVGQVAGDRRRVARAHRGRIRSASVDVEPNSRIRLITSRAGEQRMALERGRDSARASGRRRDVFFVNTPSATAIDLGCAYKLKVDDRGWGTGGASKAGGWRSNTTGASPSSRRTRCAPRAPGFGPGTPVLRRCPRHRRRRLRFLISRRRTT